jgi:hypothetical protein
MPQELHGHAFADRLATLEATVRTIRSSVEVDAPDAWSALQLVERELAALHAHMRKVGEWEERNAPAAA